MAITLLDIFRGAVDEELADHVPNVGDPWHITATLTPRLDGAPDGNATPYLFDGGVYLDDSGATNMPFAGTAADMPSADYTVSAEVRRYASPAAGDLAGIVARWNGTTTWYELSYREADNSFHLVKRVAGVETSLATYAVGLVDGQSMPIRLTLTGTSLVVQLSETEEAPVVDNAIAAAGKAGLRKIGSQPDTATIGLHLAQFQAV